MENSFEKVFFSNAHMHEVHIRVHFNMQHMALYYKWKSVLNFAVICKMDFITCDIFLHQL